MTSCNQPHNKDNDPLYNSRVIKIFLEYLEKQYPDVDIDSILDYAEMTKYEVEDQGCWFNQRHVDRFNEILVAKTGNPNIAREAGRYAVSSEGFGVVKKYFLGLMSLMSLYMLAEKLYPIMSRGATVKVRKLGPNKVEMISIPKPGVNEKPYQCENRMGTIESVAKLFTKSFAKIEHPSCFHKGDACCRYIITWEKTPFLIWKRIRNYSLLLSLLASLALLFVMPAMAWIVLVLLAASLTMMVSLYSDHLEKKELTSAIETQSGVAKHYLDEMNVRYTNALLVQEIGQATSTVLDVDKLSNAVVSVMEKRLDFDRGIIMLANRESARLVYAAGYGYTEDQEELLRRTEFHLDKPESKGAFVVAFKEQKPFLIDDIAEDNEKLSERSRELVNQMGVHSIVCVPIIYEKESLGILSVDNVKSRRPLTQSDMSLLMGVASQTAVSIANAMSFQRLQESKEKYRTILEGIEEAYYEVDLTGNITFFNDSTCRILGYSKNELIGMNNRQFMDQENAEEVYQTFNKVYSTGKPDRGFDWEIRRKDGTKRYVEASVSLIKDAKGQPIGFRGIGRDVTERRQAEEALRESNERLLAVLNSIDADVYVADLETYEVLFMNKHMQDSFGKDLVGKPCYQVFRGEGQPCGHCPNQRLLDENCSPTGVLVWEDHNPITQRFYRNYDRAIKWMDGRLVRLQVATDITDAKQAEEEKKKLEAQLLQAQRMEAIGTLAGGIAHDFNNLLMAIQGNASLMLLESDTGHPFHEKLKNIEHSVKSGAELTRQLLGFARKGKYEVKPTDINELIKRTSEMFGRTKKEITIQGKHQEGIWPVEVDKGQIEQVLLNLYVNAWQAMPAGGELSLETQNTTLDETDTKPYQREAGRYVKISVTDTGIGMDKRTQQRIFEPFFTTKEMGRGTGLGLASVYGIITNHAGIITVDSTKGEGTTFTIYLPASEKEVIKKEKVPEEILKGTETVLLVDDEYMVIEVAQEMLNTLGYTVLIARGGKEAIELYKKNPDKIDIIILDMIMPEMGGGEVYDRLKEINPDIRVLLSSGYSIDGQAKQILERGCDGFIQKPFNMGELSQKMREILDEKHDNQGGYRKID